MIAQAFRRDGFVVVRGLIASDVLDGLCGEIGDVFNRRLHALGVPGASGIDQASVSASITRLFARDLQSYIATAKQTQHLACVHQLGVSQQILGSVAQLGIDVPALSTRPVIHYMSDQLVIAGGYHKTPAHQDWRSVQGSLDGLTIWLPLYDVGQHDYPLEINAGSHRFGLLPSREDPFGHRIEDGQIDESAFRPVLLQRGDVVFFSGFLVHRTGSSGGKNVRIALSFRYNNASEPTFVDRNYPGPYIYRPDMRLLVEDFPTQEDLAQFF